MTDQAVEYLAGSSATQHRHLKGVDGEILPQRVGELPADHHARLRIEDEGGVDPADVGLHIHVGVGPERPAHLSTGEILRSPLRPDRRDSGSNGGDRRDHPASLLLV